MSQCYTADGGSKRVYQSQGEAKKAARLTSRSNRNTNRHVRMRAYRCEPCGGYHVGHAYKLDRAQ